MRTFGVFAAVGLTASAGAQQTIQPSILFSNASPLPGETITVTLAGQVVNVTDALSLGALRGSMFADVGVLDGAGFANNMPIWPFTAYPGLSGVFNNDNGYVDFIAAYDGDETGGPDCWLPVPSPFGMSAPAEVWKFDYTIPADFVGGEVVTFSYAGAGSAIIVWGCNEFGWFGGDRTVPNLSAVAELNVIIPAPGSPALLGLGGLVAVRRRRA